MTPLLIKLNEPSAINPYAPWFNPNMQMKSEKSCISKNFSFLGFQLKKGSFKESAQLMLTKRTAKMNLVATAYKGCLQ